MSAPAETSKPAATETTPESPTTARPLEMDDDEVQETGVLSEEGSTPKTAATTAPPATVEDAPEGAEAAAPPKPPRPVTEQQKNEQILKEAFPTVDINVIKAVLTASGGRIEPAFNALLEMTDPEAASRNELPPPPQPPRPVVDPLGPTATPQSQLEADELYARQLAEQYENVGAYEARTSNRGPGMPRGRQQTGLRPNDEEREHSFVDDDLPVIRDNLRKGFLDTQAKVNTWFTNLKKRIDESFDQDEEAKQRGPGGPFMGRPTRDQSRRSNDYDRYDADPELLSDDFDGMKFNSDGTPIENRRPLSNPNLFKPPPPSKSPKPADGRKVAFSDNVDNIDTYDASPKLPPKDSTPSSGGKTSKWQPLSMVDPSPIAENDPFSLGDSDDEREVKDKSGKEGGGIKMEDSERLKRAAAEAMADSLVEPSAKPAADKKE